MWRRQVRAGSQPFRLVLRSPYETSPATDRDSERSALPFASGWGRRGGAGARRSSTAIRTITRARSFLATWATSGQPARTATISSALLVQQGSRRLSPVLARRPIDRLLQRSRRGWTRRLPDSQPREATARPGSTFCTRPTTSCSAGPVDGKSVLFASRAAGKTSWVFPLHRRDRRRTPSKRRPRHGRRWLLFARRHQARHQPQGPGLLRAQILPMPTRAMSRSWTSPRRPSRISRTLKAYDSWLQGGATTVTSTSCPTATPTLRPTSALVLERKWRRGRAFRSNSPPATSASPPSPATADTIAFERDFGIALLDIATSQVSLLSFDDRRCTLASPDLESADYNGTVDDYDLAPDGKRIVSPSMQRSSSPSPERPASFAEITDSSRPATRTPSTRPRRLPRLLAYVFDACNWARRDLHRLGRRSAGELQERSPISTPSNRRSSGRPTRSRSPSPAPTASSTRSRPRART